jgi:hypothetical protein
MIQKQQSDEGISGLFVVENDVEKRLLLKKKYLTVRKVPRSNRKIVRTEVKSMCVSYIANTNHGNSYDNHFHSTVSMSTTRINTTYSA